MNNKNIFYFLLFALFILTSCGTDDPEKNGVKAGKIHCESKEIFEKLMTWKKICLMLEMIYMI